MNSANPRGIPLTDAPFFGLSIKRVGSVRVDIPRYQTAGASGLDLHAAIDRPMRLVRGSQVLIGTGIAIQLPPGFGGQVRPRSGLTREGVWAAWGTIDNDYRGEVGVTLRCFAEGYTIEPLQRIAQLVISPLWRAEIREVDELESTERGANGFGSTGK